MINFFMGELEQCKTVPPPAICCEGAVGTIYSTLKVSESEIVIGGEFINTFNIDSDVVNESGEGESLTFKMGYQNLALLPIQSSATDGGLIPSGARGANHTSKDMIGGPNGEVLTLTCAHWSEVLGRCVEIVAGGAFTMWEKFDIGADFQTTKVSERVEGVAGVRHYKTTN